jgi:alkylation response protein AidB-like acyl-CoA dehydrogenase
VTHMPGLLAPTDRQAEIMSMAARLAQRFSPRADEGGFPFENYPELHEAGYDRLMIPTSYGGGGADVFEMVLAQEVLARGDASTALVTGMLISVLGKAYEGRSWPEVVLEDVSRQVVDHGGMVNNCVTEPELGSISRGGVPSMRAERVEGGWKLFGHKIFVTGAPALKWLVTAAVLPPEEGAPQGTLCSAIVAGASPGLRIVDTWSGSLALRGCGNSDVFYDGVFVPEERIVERVVIGVGGRNRPGTNGWALPIAAVYLGVGQAAVDAACRYARERVPPSLGRPIAEQPHIIQWIGEMDATLAGARAVLHETARAWVDHPARRAELGARIGMAKYLCTNAACAVTEKALRVAGGFSLTKGLPLERYFRDARGGLFQPPQDDLALGQIGRAALAR